MNAEPPLKAGIEAPGQPPQLTLPKKKGSAKKPVANGLSVKPAAPVGVFLPAGRTRTAAESHHPAAGYGQVAVGDVHGVV
ncbi:MAG: hypothetical protein U1F68_19065 [Gammaproteobacteria bacterium]